MFIYEKLLDISEDWLKYAIQLNLLHKNKNDLVELKNQVLNCEK